MLGKGLLTIVSFVSSLAAALPMMGCSGGDGSSPPSDAPDSGASTVSEGDQQAPEYVAVQVQGSGTVLSQDAAPTADGGITGSVVCSSGSPASRCSAQVGTTLYAFPASGWALAGFTAPGLAAGTDLAGARMTYTVTAATPSTLMVVFAESP